MRNNNEQIINKKLSNEYLTLKLISKYMEYIYMYKYYLNFFSLIVSDSFSLFNANT